ncbi:glycoside hydrolase family 30 protein [Purpureocillium lavendulum]|uniref:Glycoside hydrolase family 30 protein n=1 Tax=Purpureocillium lavendulum TaxID=1247861 RepID=A0AB34FPV8_9HYPO|nr:glycoside hydrolase family 30 protein [Purpureocillium lavendulum]
MATEDERYRQSSQFRLWSFAPANLQDLRDKTNALAKQQISTRLTPTPEFLTTDEEARLVKFFTVELIRAAQFCELPTEIRSTAAMFLRRFYITNSVMTYPPTELLKTSLFFGCKAEGFYIRLAKLAEKFPNTTSEQILAGEFLLCQGIRFTFDVRHPFRALEGAILELRRRLPGEEARVNKAHARAREILKFSALVTDVYFHFTPSQIMMAALLMVDSGLLDVLLPKPAPPHDDNSPVGANTDMHERILTAVEDCRAMLEDEPPERMTEYWGTPEIVKSMKPLRKKLQKCRDPDRADLVALQRARREQAVKPKKPAPAEPAMFGEDLRDVKRRKVDGDDVFGAKKSPSASNDAMLLSLLLALHAAAAGALASLDRRAGASAWASSADGKYKLSQVAAPALGGSNPGLDTWDLTVADKTGLRQTIKGFGAALLRDLMGPEGLNFNLMRHTVASSDLSADPAYSYDDNGGRVDTGLAGFNLGDRGDAMVSMLAEMRRLQPDLTILGSPWSPPGWMQLDGVITGTTTNNNLNHQYVDAYAQYFVKYLQAYDRGGAHIDAITIQNEPLNSRAQMPTMYIFADESGALIRDNVGPAIKQAGLTTQIWAFDHNTQDYDYPETVVNMNAKDTVQAAAWHCYSGNDPSHWAPLSRFHDQFPDREQYMTECWTAVGTTDWVHSSNFALLPLQNWANGIIAWALGSFTGGGPVISGGDACGICTGLVTVDPSGASYRKEVDYYMMGQFSRFMPKGGRALAGTGSYLFPDGTGIESVATLNPDGTRTVVLQNRYDHDIWVQVSTEGDGKWSGRAYAKAVTTWVLPKA